MWPSHSIAVPAEPAPDEPQDSSTTVGPFTFATGAYELRVLPPALLPYNGSSIVSSCGLTDSAGVAMFQTGGVIYNHPVAQTRCALNMQRNFRLTGDRAYLDIAVANANRLLSLAVTHNNAIFFPYPFNWNNVGRSYMSAPWYSAMAQGQALSAFVRLFEWTGDQKWRSAADRTFASFKVAHQAGKPWVVAVEGGQLWLDEYPTVPADRVFNGHNFSMYGLYDYWRITGNQEARLLTLGALHSSYVGGSSRIRVPGGISHYCASDACLAARVRNPAYHITHIGQLQKIFHITGHWHFGSLAEAFIGDAPRTSPGRVQLAAGGHDGYAFDAAGNVTGVKHVSFTDQVAVSYSRRDVPGGRVKPGNGIWMLVSSGSLSGLWVRESPRAAPLGLVDTLSFHWPRPVRVAAGAYTGRSFDASGGQLSTLPVSTAATSWTYTDYARINGVPSILISSGPLAGLWLGLDHRTIRDSTSFTDIDSSIFRNEIIWLTAQRITRGCATYRFCPAANVTREQMASFLVRALHLPPTSRDFFTDDNGRPAENDINRLAATGITAGCGSGRYCPSRVVTRAQMASFLARALSLPHTVRDFFTDDSTSPHEGDINRLSASGVTGGCGTNRFCPSAGVTRGQMAAFLYRALSLGAVSLSNAGLGADATSPSPSTAPQPASSPSQPGETPLPSASPSTTAEPAPSTTPSPTPEPTPTPSPAGVSPTADPTSSPSPSSSVEPTPDE